MDRRCPNGITPCIQQKQAEGAVTFTGAVFQDAPNVIRRQRLQNFLFEPRHLHLGKGRFLKQLITHTVIEKGADGAGDVMLILARQLATVEFNQVAADVMRGQILDGFNAIRFAPTKEKGEFTR